MKADHPEINEIFKIQNKLGYFFHGDAYRAERMEKIIEKIVAKNDESSKLFSSKMPVIVDIEKNPAEDDQKCDESSNKNELLKDMSDNEADNVRKRNISGNSTSTRESIEGGDYDLKDKRGDSISKSMDSYLNRDHLQSGQQEDSKYTDHEYWKTTPLHDFDSAFKEVNPKVDISACALNSLTSSLRGISSVDNFYSIGDYRGVCSHKKFVKIIESYSKNTTLLKKDKEIFLREARYTIAKMEYNNSWTEEQIFIAQASLDKVQSPI